MGRLISKYRGFAGSVRAIVAHPSEPHFISCGIDRHAIVHNIDSREIVKKVSIVTGYTKHLTVIPTFLSFPQMKFIIIKLSNYYRIRNYSVDFDMKPFYKEGFLFFEAGVALTSVD